MTDERQTPASPKGIGLYMRAMPKGRIEKRVKRMADNGIKWAAIGAIWQEDNRTKIINNQDRCKAITDALLSHGIDPYLWGYPWVGREEEFAELMAKASTEATIGWLLDPEKGLKKKKWNKEFDEMEEVFASAKLLFWKCVETNPYRSIGFTSYGQIKGHPTFPWDAFAEKGGFDPLNEVDYGSPQLYDQPPAMISKGLGEYREMGFDVIVPSFSTYKFAKDVDGSVTYPRMSYEELDEHLKRFEVHKEEYDIQAMIGWSEMQIRARSWRAIAECSERFQEAA